jgi:hypothetical protein
MMFTAEFLLGILWGAWGLYLVLWYLGLWPAESKDG